MSGAIVISLTRGKWVEKREWSILSPDRMRQYLKHPFDRIGPKATYALRRVPIVKQYVLNQQFRTERQLLAHTHQTQDRHPSVLHFSVNRAATQYVKSILRRCAVANSLTNVGLHDYAFYCDLPYLNTLSKEEIQPYIHAFKPQGYVYSVFGGMIEGIPQLERYRTVLMVRDPRDILVSGYYAIAYSHFSPGQSTKKRQFTMLRQQAQAMSIDDYVGQQCDRICAVFERYQRLLVGPYPEVYVTRFEDMVSDFPNWLSALLNHCELEISHHLYQRLVEEHIRLTPQTENVQRHVRKGAVGDYLEKLTPSTIEYVQLKCVEILRDFKYS